MDSFFQQITAEERNTDYLTGLYNRRGLIKVWESLQESGSVHCIYIDVDNFKLINDTYGHSKGDRLLAFIGSLLRNAFEDQTVVRMGGDEFVVLCDGKLDPSCIKGKMPVLQQMLHKGDFDETIEKLLSFSIGMSCSQPVSLGLNAIIEQSDVAMYYVKKHGKGNYIDYEAIRERVEEERAIKARALSGVVKQEIRILFRPVIYLQTSDVIGVETVLYWDFPGKGVLPEEKFMSVFRQYGVAIETDEFVLEQVCRQKAAWRGTDLSQLRIYVKLSGIYLMQRDCVGHILQCLRNYQTDPEELVLCIAEKEFLKNAKKMHDVVQALMNAGFAISIDDFASISSLRSLQKLSSCILQLDPKLLMEAGQSGTGVLILRSVIGLGRDLRCSIVAKGIERVSQIEMLANYGAQFGTGDFYGEPCAPEAFMERYADRIYYVKNKYPHTFSFENSLADGNGTVSGEFVGTGLSFTTGVIREQSAVHFPGGGVKENIVFLPKHIMYSESYSISFWVNPDMDQRWASIIYITYMDGFMSLIPSGGDGAFFFRIKDDREANEWHDIMCRRAVEGQWSFICVTYDVITGLGKLYFNGLLVGSRENMPNLKVPNQIMLGGDEYQNSYKGKLAGLEINHYVISAEQVERKFREFQKNPTFLGTKGKK